MNEDELKALIRSAIEPGNAPSLLRLAFHDAGTFCRNTRTGGVSGSITTSEELRREENDGLQRAADIVTGIKADHPELSLADIIAVAGAVGVELCGGPSIEVGVGRPESPEPAPGGRLPDKDHNVESLLDLFQRMGFTKQELVVLSGAHTIGDAEDRPFTEDRLTFNNSYFQRLASDQRPDHLRFFNSDEALLEDPELELTVQKYAASKKAFLEDFSAAYKKMTWLGVERSE